MDRGLQGICACSHHAWGVVGMWHVTIVSPSDAALLDKYVWTVVKNPRSKTTYVSAWDGNKTVYLHRVVTNVIRPAHVDHENRDGLDNRQENLREATPVQNGGNRLKLAKTKWPYKGVRFRYGSWVAQIGINYKFVHLGSFPTPEDAAAAYDAAAKKHYGKFARLNLETSDE